MSFEMLLNTLLGILAAVMVSLPGFFLSAMLFKHEQWPWKIGAGFGITVMIIGGIALLLSYTSIGIHYTSILITVLLLDIVTFILFLKSYYVVIKNIDFGCRSLVLYVRNNNSMMYGWVLLFLALVCVPIFIQPKSEHFTEFFFVDGYLSGSEVPWRHGTPNSAPFDIAIGIRSHEVTSTTYYLRVTDNEQEIEAINLGEIQPGADFERSIRLPRNTNQSHNYRFLLYKDNDNHPYRELSFLLEKS